MTVPFFYEFTYKYIAISCMQTFFESQEGAGNDSEELLAGAGLCNDDRTYRPIRTLPAIVSLFLLTVSV